MFLIPRTSSFLSFSTGDDHFELASQSSRALCIVHTKSLRKMYFFYISLMLIYITVCRAFQSQWQSNLSWPPCIRVAPGHSVSGKGILTKFNGKFPVWDLKIGFPKASGDLVFLQWSTGTKPSFQILFQGRFISPDLPGRERELNEFVAGVQGLRLVGHLLCQEPHLVVVQPVHRDPPASEVVGG